MEKSLTYARRRGQLEAYFDRTAAEAWARLTSDAPVGGIRATVRAGRTQMRDHILSTLPEDLSGARIYDAGCGTGALAMEAHRRGAEVVAVDISPTLVELAGERAREMGLTGIDFRVSDMLDDTLGEFDFVVAMDSLIHYPEHDMVQMVARLSERARKKVVFTYAPRTPLLALMHWVGSFFPKGNRAPAIEPISTRRLQALLKANEVLGPWGLGDPVRVQRGFYTSTALEVERP